MIIAVHTQKRLPSGGRSSNNKKEVFDETPAIPSVSSPSPSCLHSSLLSGWQMCTARRRNTWNSHYIWHWQLRKIYGDKVMLYIRQLYIFWPQHKNIHNWLRYDFYYCKRWSQVQYINPRAVIEKHAPSGHQVHEYHTARYPQCCAGCHSKHL